MKVKVINRSEHPLPAYQTSCSAGMDLRAVLDKNIVLKSLQRQLIPTGLYLELPTDTEAQIRSRSGLAHKHGLTVLNSPGTVDADYRGEIKVLLVNLSDRAYTIKNGDRIAQMVVSRHERIEWEAVNELSDTVRSDGGYGSTGVGVGSL